MTDDFLDSGLPKHVSDAMNAAESVERLFEDTDPVDQVGPYLVTTTGAALARPERVTLDRLPPVGPLEFGGKIVHCWYDAEEPDYILGEGWLVDLSGHLPVGAVLRPHVPRETSDYPPDRSPV